MRILILVSMLMIYYITGVWSETIPDFTDEEEEEIEATRKKNHDKYLEFPCVKDSSKKECKDFKYPHVEHDVKHLCMEMPYMPGCSIERKCVSMDKKDGFCSQMSIGQDICFRDPSMENMSGCKVLNLLCKEDPKSVVSECTSNPPFKSIPGTMEIKKEFRPICGKGDEDPRFKETCQLYKEKFYLEAVISYCKVNSEPSICKSWNEMCSEIKDIKMKKQFCPIDSNESGNKEEKEKGTKDEGSGSTSSYSEWLMGSLLIFAWVQHQ